MSQAPAAPAVALVVFGAMGDLTRRLLTPALVNLAGAGLLDGETRLIGVGHQDVDDAGLQASLGAFVKAEDYARIKDRIAFIKGEFQEAATFKALAAQDLGNAIFYLATAASLFGPIVENLADAGLLSEARGFRRVIVEKPFGADLESAKALNAQLLSHAAEPQIYRIDHFLGKETVQNIMVARFGNTLLEAVWNNRYIDHVQITAAETVDVGTRGRFYDATGALRDMTPNHLMQLVAMVGMEAPNSFGAEAVLAEKAKLIDAVRPLRPEDAVRGRYVAGEVGGKPVGAYVDAPDVDPATTTETYVALKLQVDTWRWSGVPFYLRTGKALAARDTEIVVQFRDAPIKLFAETDGGSVPPNRFVIQVQPDEGLKLEMAAKTPGPAMETTPVSLDFHYADRFQIAGRTGYETLLYDVMTGDRTLFPLAEQLESGWRAVQPLLDAWAADKTPPQDYAAGSRGPRAADDLLARDGRAWHAFDARVR